MTANNVIPQPSEADHEIPLDELYLTPPETGDWIHRALVKAVIRRCYAAESERDAAVAEAVKAERESCAAEADAKADMTVQDEWDKGANWAARRIAAAIRERLLGGRTDER